MYISIHVYTYYLHIAVMYNNVTLLLLLLLFLKKVIAIL